MSNGAVWAGDRQPIAIIGRLRPGISSERASEELKTIDTKLTSGVLYGQVLVSSGPLLQSLQIYLYGDQRPMLRMLGAAAILFLMLVCAGVVNLLITQGIKRKQEIATRLIFGATRRNLVFQLVRETLPLVITSGLAGLWLSETASAWMWKQMPMLRGGEVEIPVKIVFVAALMLIVTLVGGLIPSFYATKLDLNSYLKSASGGSRRFFSTREFLVGVQLSLALALLIGMGVLLRSMMFNVDIPIGWSSRDIAVVSVLHQRGLGGAKLSMLSQDIRNELHAMPEVISAGHFSPIPFSKDVAGRRNVLYKTRRPDPQVIQQDGWDLAALVVDVSPDVFDVLDIPLVVGRYFTGVDEAGLISNSLTRYMGLYAVTIINQVLAERLWPGENPVGKMFYDLNNTSYEVVGVVRNIHYAPGNKDFTPTMYLPDTGRGINQTFLVRLRPGTSFQNFHSNARRRLSGFTLNWIEVQPLSGYIKDATANQRLTLQLLFGFAVLGITVSGLSVYATATLMAAARTRETGIRMAVGARTWDILRLAFLRGVRAIILGLPVGLEKNGFSKM